MEESEPETGGVGGRGRLRAERGARDRTAAPARLSGTVA